MAEAEMLDLGLDEPPGPEGDGDNITDWCLEQFRGRYGDAIDKDAVWEYIYGVMHAPDWRQRYKHDLQRNLPRIPLADDFEAFRFAGRELMDLHIGYETCPEYPLTCEVDGEPDSGEHSPEVYRMGKVLKWGRSDANARVLDKTVLVVNDRVRLVGIPEEANAYTVSGRSPLEWAISSLKLKHDKASGIVDDPNGWHAWVDNPSELLRHLCRLVHLSVRSAEIIASLPPSLSADPVDQDHEESH